MQSNFWKVYILYSKNMASGKNSLQNKSRMPVGRGYDYQRSHSNDDLIAE
jgi:hypothetical protein